MAAVVSDAVSDLRGQRVALRVVTENDLSRLLAILREPAVARWWSPPDDVADARTIDPKAANTSAISAYEKVGFKRVGILRRYERGPDGTFHDGMLLDLLPEDLISAGFAS